MSKAGSRVEVGRLNDRVEVLGLRSVSVDTPSRMDWSEVERRDAQRPAGQAESEGSRGGSVSNASVTTPRIWEWEPIRRTWAQAELATRPNVYSVHGLGAAGVSFTLRRQPLDLDSALRWRGQHCLITAIRPLGRMYLTVDAALVVLSQCRNPRTGEAFPAVMTEEYVRHQQLEPMAVNSRRRVLVAPKAVRLTPGPLVEVDGTPWPIVTAYELDPHKNEYMLERTVDL